MFRLGFVLFAALCIVALSCKKTVESEKNRWQNAKSKNEQLIVQYPAFQQIIIEIQSEADQLMADALRMDNEEEKIDKMSEAIRTATPTFIRNLSSIEERIADLQEQSRNILLKVDGEINKIAASAIDRNIQNLIDQTRTALRTTNVVTTVGAAQLLVDDAIKLLDQASQTASDFEKAITPDSTEIN